MSVTKRYADEPDAMAFNMRGGVRCPITRKTAADREGERKLAGRRRVQRGKPRVTAKLSRLGALRFQHGTLPIKALNGLKLTSAMRRQRAATKAARPRPTWA